ncbi:type VI secretion system baseplate subunit TssF [Cupriavidus pauculus]|uniref:type VI secretion system baseplate subunit TssF n=1 Tax=Cupriavidus pauculus TaxID=82633 RepID=UPI001D0C3037|nr:type VI secretion system baseplate subunit TssF [Cupriavidus pauculus]
MEELLPYYERELAYLRRYSRDFAERYPKIAGRLAMSADNCDDPHVERMIESFAFLTARISKKLDDDYPELTDSLLEVMYPHYLRPFPSCSIVHFEASAGTDKLTAPIAIARGSMLETRDIGRTRCNFRTAYDVRLSPVSVADARYDPTVLAPRTVSLPKGATGAIRITIDAGPERDLARVGLDSLRLYLDGEPSFISVLGDALHLHTAAAYVEGKLPGVWHRLKDVPVKPVGYAENEALLETPARSHPAYRLLTEHFAFAEKFNFIDIDLKALCRAFGVDVEGRCGVRRATLHLVLRDLRADSPAARQLENLRADHLREHCSPVVNLFDLSADPIDLDHTRVAYPVVASSQAASSYEVYSINRVTLVRKGEQGQVLGEFRPFYSLHHGETPGDTQGYWVARRNPVMLAKSPGFETELSLVDLHFDPVVPQTSTLSLNVTCSNRDLPASLAFGSREGDLTLKGSSSARTIRFLRKPTASMRLAGGRESQWRLISLLALNHLSLVQNGLSTLKEMLRLHDLSHAGVTARQIDGLVQLEYRPTTQWLAGKPFATFVRGLEVRLTLDEDAFVGTGLHRFIRVMDHFFGLYVHLNSFVQLVVVSHRTGKELIQCAPRSGESILL